MYVGGSESETEKSVASDPGLSEPSTDESDLLI
jgi:hypothetical protein